MSIILFIRRVGLAHNNTMDCVMLDSGSQGYNVRRGQELSRILPVTVVLKTNDNNSTVL